MFKNIIPWKNKKSDLKTYKDNPLESFHRQMNSLFDSFFDDSENLFSIPDIWGRENSWFKSPEVDFSENNKEIKITANVPGLDEKDLNVNLDGDRLIIEGSVNESKEDKDEKYYFSERRSGHFKRVIPVKEEIINKDKISASLKKGVLKIILPKNAAKISQQKKIKVNAA